MFKRMCRALVRPYGRPRNGQRHVTRFLLIPLVCLTVSGPLHAQNIQDVSTEARTWVNDARAQAGRVDLALSPALTDAAVAHARDLAQTGRFSHVGSNGSSVGHRVRRQGYGFCFVAENIAKGQGSLDAVLKGWMTSEGHRRNMLAKQARDFGLVRGPGDLWVMVLGASGC